MGQRTPNEQLLYERESRGWSQREVARGIGTTEKRISAWEQGTNEPSTFYQEKLCMLFGKSVEELGFIRTRTMDTPIPAAIQESTNMEERLDDAETIIDLCWEAWFASRPERASQEIFKVLPRLYKARLESISLIHQLRAQELAIRCHGLLGLIYLDTLQNDTSMYHFAGAHRMATEIHDLDQSATYLTLVGTVLRRKGQKPAAISRMELALDQLPLASHTTRGHILQALAYTYANTGNEPGFERTISEATNLLAHTGEGLDAVKHEFVPFGTYMLHGKAYRSLGKPLAAIPYLEQAEKSLVGKPVAPRWQALIQISKAQVLCDTGDLQAGIELAKQGFLLASHCQSPRQMNRVKQLLRELENSGHKEDKRVGDLRELLHEVYIRG